MKKLQVKDLESVQIFDW